MMDWLTAPGAVLGQALHRALAGSYTYAILSVFLVLLSHLWYFMLIGPAVGVLVARLTTVDSIKRALEQRGLWGAALAALLGMASPACTFATIPVVAGLLASGVPVVPLMAFLVAAPLMNPSLFVITWGVMGAAMAVARTVAAFCLAMVAAWIAQVLIRRGWVDGTDAVTQAGRLQTHRRHHGSCPMPAAEGRPTRTRLLAEVWSDYLHLTRFVVTYFALSLLVASALQVFLPSGLVAEWLGGRRLESALIGGLLGIPFYVCGGGAVATVAVLMSLNMGQGAALAFFLTGPATKVSTLFSLFAVMRPWVIALYLGVTLVGGVTLGAAYGQIAPAYRPHLIYAGQIETSEDLSRYWQGTRPPATWQWNH